MTNADFTTTLAEVLGRPAVLAIPRFALNLRLGKEMAEGTALANQRVRSERLASDGFQFSHPDLEPALRHVLSC